MVAENKIIFKTVVRIQGTCTGKSKGRKRKLINKGKYLYEQT